MHLKLDTLQHGYTAHETLQDSQEFFSTFFPTIDFYCATPPQRFLEYFFNVGHLHYTITILDSFISIFYFLHFLLF